MHIRTLGLALCGALSLVACAQPAPEAQGAPAGSDSRTLPDRIFAEDSFWYRTLPADAPLDPKSGEIVRRILDEAPDPGHPELSRGAPGMAINTDDYTPPIYIARNSDPVVTFSWNNCQWKRDDMGLISKNLTRIHVPEAARPSTGSDGEMTIYNVDSDTYTDTWQTRFDGDTWSACWGGTIRNASKNPGVFPSPYGTTASGLPLEPGTIKARELVANRIDHVVGIVVPAGVIGDRPVPPATRTDGEITEGPTIAQGQLMRLPADLDLDTLHLGRVARAMAEAAQTYGFIVWDRGEGISFRAENVQAFHADPYPAVFGGTHSALSMWGDPNKGEQPFPFHLLEVLEPGYVPGGAPQAPPTESS